MHNSKLIYCWRLTYIENNFAPTDKNKLHTSFVFIETGGDINQLKICIMSISSASSVV